MSARRHRNDGSRQKPLHVWFPRAPPFNLQFQRVLWSLRKIYQLQELPKRVATHKDGVALIPDDPTSPHRAAFSESPGPFAEVSLRSVNGFTRQLSFGS